MRQIVLVQKGCAVRFSDSVRTVVSQDGMIITDIEQGLMFGVNPIGSLIWEKLTQGLLPDEVARHLAAECSISEEQALADVSEFLQKIEELRLLHSPHRTDEAQTGSLVGVIQRFRARTCPKTAA